MADLYLWIKAIHIIAVIALMAGLLYLPRLFAYHVSYCKPGSEHWNMFATMEKRLLRIIIAPAIITTFVLGIILTSMQSAALFSSGIWLHVKIILALGLAGFHGWSIGQAKKLAKGTIPHSAKTYKMINEIPTVIMILIVILVIVKPF